MSEDGEESPFPLPYCFDRVRGSTGHRVGNVPISPAATSAVGGESQRIDATHSLNRSAPGGVEVQRFQLFALPLISIFVLGFSAGC